MHTLRARAIERLRHSDHHDRFRIFYPVNEAEEPIYVHAKITTVDDRLLRIGSSNIDDRSMGFDTECDIAFEGTHDGARRAIRDFRLRLLAEHLDTEPDEVAETWEREGSLVATIDALNSETGRGLRDVEVMEEHLLGTFLADTRLLDQRFEKDEGHMAGRGFRPRHALVAAGVGVALLGTWFAWRQWRSDREI